MPDTERELFDSAMSNEPEAQPVTIAEPEAPKEPEPESKPDDGERARDDKGRFAPKAEAEPEKKPEQAKEPDAAVQAQEPVAQQPVKEPEDRIPSWRLKEEADAKREAIQRAEQAEQRAQAIERQMYQLQQQFQQQSRQQEVPKPNLFENPEQYEQYQQQQFQSELHKQELRFARYEAKRHGEAFNLALQESQKILQSGAYDPHLAAIDQMNPLEAVEELINWHKRKQALDRVGSDPDEFLKQEREKWKNDPAIQAEIIELARKQAQGNSGPAIQTQPVTKLPSLNRQTSAANSNPDSEEESDAELFKSAIRR